MNASMQKGLFLLVTGNGKGKTTSSLGAAMRMAGHGGRVAVVQFIKSGKRYGEQLTAGNLGESIEFHTLGLGFVREEKGPADDDRTAARAALEKARALINSGDYALVVLDEATYLPGLGFATEEEILEIINNRPAGVHVYISGRNAPESFVRAADMVTEVKEVKHPYNDGRGARKGVEF